MFRRLLLVFLVALAGCGSGSFASSSGPEQTLTPAAVPEPPATAAPGVPVEGPVNADRLLAADERVRNGTSYRVVRNVTVSGDGWTTRADRVRDVNGTVSYQRLDITESAELGAVISRGEVWTNGSAVYVRAYAPDGRRIEQGKFPSTPRHYTLLPALRGRLLHAGEFRANATGDGAVLRPVGEAMLSTNPIVFTFGNPRNVTARVTVAESGLITSIRVAYDASFQDKLVRVEIRHRLVAVGNTTVERPVWATTDR